jgi:glycogen phosphorylase
MNKDNTRLKPRKRPKSKHEHVVIPLYYKNRDGWLNIMRHAIALNGSFFNTQRMLLQYVLKAYFE